MPDPTQKTEVKKPDSAVKRGRIFIQIHCKMCNSQQIYTNKDGTIVCRRCGYRSKEKGE